MDIFENFRWHSSMELNEGISKKRIIRSLSAKQANLERFTRIANGSFLVHKSTKALWKFADDQQTIEPVFQDDVLTEDVL